MAKAHFKITLDNGVTPLVLTHNPIGITEFELTYNRHKVYNSVFPAIGTALKFVKEGFDYIQAIFDASGLDGECDIKIEEQQLINKTYTTVFNGVLNFSTYIESDTYLEVDILENSLMALFVAREETEVNVISDTNIDGDTITPPTLTDLILPPIEPTLWATSNDSTFTDSQSTIVNYATVLDPFGLSSINLIGDDYDESSKQYTNTTGADVKCTVEYDVDIDISGFIVMTSTTGTVPPPLLAFYVYLKRLDGGADVPIKQVLLTGLGTLSLDDTVNINGSFTSTVVDTGISGAAIGISVDFVSCVGSSGFGVSGTFNTYDLSVKFITSVADATINAIKPVTLGNAILNVMGIDVSTAPFTSTELGNIFLASGMGIRRFPDDTPINISFRDFFISYSALFGLGFNYNGSGFTFKKVEDYYDQTATPFVISSASNIEKAIALDWYFSGVTAGYNNQEYEFINGRLEFNTGFSFTSINKNTKEKLDIKSVVQADSIGIEILRRNPYYSKASYDVKNEDKNYFISALFSVTDWEAELGTAFSPITGFRDPYQYYNYRITPKRNLINNGFWVNTSLNYKTKELSYISSKNEVDLVSDGLVELDGDYSAASSGGLIPVTYTFETILTPTLRAFLDATPNDPISIVYKGDTIKLFIQECKVIPYSKKVTITGIQYTV